MKTNKAHTVDGEITKLKRIKDKEMQGKERRLRVAVCTLLIAWNPSGELKPVPSDQPSASLAAQPPAPSNMLHKATLRWPGVDFKQQEWTDFSIYMYSSYYQEDFFLITFCHLSVWTSSTY